MDCLKWLFFSGTFYSNSGTWTITYAFRASWISSWGTQACTTAALFWPRNCRHDAPSACRLWFPAATFAWNACWCWPKLCYAISDAKARTTRAEDGYSAWREPPTDSAATAGTLSFKCLSTFPSFNCHLRKCHVSPYISSVIVNFLMLVLLLYMGKSF